MFFQLQIICDMVVYSLIMYLRDKDLRVFQKIKKFETFNVERIGFALEFLLNIFTIKSHQNYSTPAKQELQAKAELRVIRDNWLGYAENHNSSCTMCIL